MSQNSFVEDVKHLLDKVEERFSTEEKEAVKEIMIVELLNDANKKDDPLNRKYYLYDALSMLLQSDVGELGKKNSLPFDEVYSELLERVNFSYEDYNSESRAMDSAIFRCLQIKKSLDALRESYEISVLDFEAGYEESNNHFTRHIEQ